MWQYNNSSELRHYGKLGMKWGVRREQNKAFDSYRTKAIESHPLKAKLDKLEDKAIAYGNKHNLDGDDGGGGTRAQGEHYMKLWEDHDKVYQQMDHDVHKAAVDKFISKYGEKEYKSWKRSNNVKAVAAVAAMFAVPIIAFKTAKLAVKGVGALGKVAIKGAVKVVRKFAK